MAFRSSATTTVAQGVAGLNRIANMPAGVVANDRLLALVSADGFAVVITPPAGWAEIVNGSQSAPDGQCIRLYERKQASSSEPGTYTWTTSVDSATIITIAAWSGRDNGATATFAALTNSTAANASPIAVSGTTGAAGALDDLAVFATLDKAAQADSWSFGTWGQSLTEREDTNFDWSAVGLATRDAIPAGAFGSVTVTATGTAAGAGYAVIAVALPKATPASAGARRTRRRNRGSRGNDRSRAAWTDVRFSALGWFDRDLWRVASAGGGIAGTLALSDADDTVSSAAAATAGATLSRTDATDTAASSGAVAIAASLAASDTTDALTSTAAAALAATLARQDQDDTLSAAGTVAAVGANGSLALTDGQDGVGAAGALTIAASLQVSDATDVASASAAAVVAGAFSRTDAQDGVSAAAAVALAASLARTDDQDALSASGTTGAAPVSGALALTDGADALQATGAAAVAAAAVLADDSDRAAAAGFAAVAAALGITDGNDILIASGEVTPLGGAVASLALSDATDTLVAAGTVADAPVEPPAPGGGGGGWAGQYALDYRWETRLPVLRPSLALIDGDDCVVASGTAAREPIAAAAVLVDGDDTLVAAGELSPFVKVGGLMRTVGLRRPQLRRR